ncbi:MAG: type II toxin-antitoxin system VapC family toxin [Chloroflexi bacterium]|nr:type II toxin-antitoxin system VapC family toxin [Chloroflexota bacterium]
MAGFVVVDASVAVKWLAVEEYTREANALVRHWLTENIQMVAPHHMRVEVANALYKRMVRGEHTIENVVSGVESLLAINIEFRDVSGLHIRAVQLASELRQSAVYDAHYLALAESLGGELWTADQRFHRVASDASYPVHWVGDFVAN